MASFFQDFCLNVTVDARCFSWSPCKIYLFNPVHMNNMNVASRLRHTHRNSECIACVSPVAQEGSESTNGKHSKKHRPTFQGWWACFYMTSRPKIVLLIVVRICSQKKRAIQSMSHVFERNIFTLCVWHGGYFLIGTFGSLGEVAAGGPLASFPAGWYGCLWLFYLGLLRVMFYFLTV